MSRIHETFRRLGNLTRRGRFESELDAESQFHIESRAEELQQAGLSRRDALLQARREFGSPALMREDSRAAWRFPWLEDLAADLRYAARAFRRNPAFSLTAAACLALGIGANTTIFSIAAEVLFSQPSVRDPHTLVRMEIGGGSVAPLPDYRFLHDARIFDGLAGENEEVEVNWRNGDTSSRLSVVRVTTNFFEVTGIPVAMGRPMQPGDQDSVVLTYGFWQRRLGGDPQAIGSKLILDGRVYLVSGVLPRDHRTVTGFGFSPDLYVPVSSDRDHVTLYARLDPTMTRAAALGRLKAACQELDRSRVDNRKLADSVKVSGVAGLDRIATERELMLPVAAFFGMLMIVVGLVLAIACANVAGLLLARASSRAHEFAIRLSIGAGRSRLVRQLLAESLLLALCGTAAGLALNVALTSLLSRVQLPLPVPIQFLIQPDWRLLAYAAAVTMGVSLAAGLTPAIKGTRAGISAALKRDAPHAGGGRNITLRNILVAGQLAVSIVLLSAGFLFTRNLIAASSSSPGFDVQHTIWAYMRLVPEKYRDPARTAAVVQAAEDQLRALPGVEAAAIARVVPLNGHRTNGTDITSDLQSRPVNIIFNSNYVGPGYFRAMQIPILRGRAFLPTDRAGGPRVAILNENFARRLFGEVDPVGHTVRLGQDPPFQVAGVARNSKYFTLGEENVNAWYEPYAQSSGTNTDLHLLVRATGRPEPLIPAIRAALDSLDSTAALDIKPMSQALVFALLPSRVGAAILGSVGLLGLLLAAIGLYGVLLYAVTRRIREIGLRVALGATPAGVLALVLRQSATLAAVGIALGIALSVFAVQPLAMFLSPEIRPSDWTNFAVVGAVLAAVALLATAAPAVRALRVDPVVALRHE